MDRNTILGCMYKTIKESIEWGIDSDKYGYFVDGIVAVTEELLKECNKPTLCEALKEYSDSLNETKA